LCKMEEQGGKYAKVIRRFERWFRGSQEVLHGRGHDTDDDDQEIMFVEALDPEWKDDCLVLGKKLELWRDVLQHRDISKNDSSLAVLEYNACRLIICMLTELDVMSQIEKDAVEMECEWIKSCNEAVSDEEEDFLRPGAAWRL